MRLESKKYLHDIAHAAGLALQFVEGKDFSDYVADPMLRSAAERQLQTVGEALVRYGYANIDDRVVWGVLELKLPVLLREAKSLLDEG